VATRIRYETEAASDLGSSKARRDRTGGGRDHRWWRGREARGPSLPPPRGEATRGAEADAVSASRLDGEPEARVAAAVACRSSAMALAPPRCVSAGIAAAANCSDLPESEVNRRTWAR
jgi:hypothetical protein